MRPDKIAYIQEHPELDIWLALHYAQPEEQLVYIRPDLSKRYPYRTVTINGTQERYVVFDENAPEIKSEEEFRANLISKRLHWRIKEAMEHNLAIRLALVS